MTQLVSPQRAALLLWTGGWDSTFRLLQILTETEATVRPVYVVDARRPATLHELRAMVAIRRAILESMPGCGSRLLETQLYLVDEIPADERISAAMASLRQRRHLGSQYHWLARLARYLGTRELELAIHVDDMAYAFVKDALIRLEDPEVGPYYRLGADVADDMCVFDRFRFPILQWTKVMMRDWAVSRGVGSVLELTWFCHRPRGDQPCGVCHPCRYALAEGMEARFPVTSRLLYRARRFFEVFVLPSRRMRSWRAHFVRALPSRPSAG